MKQLFFIALAINICFFAWHTMGEPGAADLVRNATPMKDWQPPSLLMKVRKKESSASNSTCFALGPFVATNIATSVLARLNERGLPATLRKTQGRKPTGYWVYLPPLESPEAAKVVFKEMIKLNIDSFIIADGEQKNGISVGFYNSEGIAQRRQQEVQSKGFDVTLEQRYKVRNEYWLDVADDGQLVATGDPLFEEFPGLQREQTRCEHRNDFEKTALLLDADE